MSAAVSHLNDSFRAFFSGRFIYRLKQNKLGLLGALGTLFFVVLAASAALVFWLGLLPEGLGYEHSDLIYAPSSAEHWFGTDEIGRDVFWRIIRGSSYTIGSGFGVIILASLVGVPLGLAAGYFGGKLDAIIMRFMDLLLAFPALLLALALITALGDSLRNAIIAIAVVYMPRFARVVRASTLQVREMEYVAACHVLGCSHWRTLFRHVFPNTLSPLLVLATLSLSGAILEVAALSFLGLGDPKLPEWGAMLNDSRKMLVIAPHLMLYPGIALALAVFSVNVFGDALRDAFDVKLD
jgi:peptide/nickel transport system permease protein